MESGSPRIMKKYMAGKALPLEVDRWPELVTQGIGVYNDHEWWPLCTLMTGIPGETEDDVLKTLELVDDLMDTKTFLVPLVFIPLEEALLGTAHRVSLDDLTESQWEFITRCWRHNMDFWARDISWWVRPAMFAVYWAYTRWKHGPRTVRPVMELVGIPEWLGRIMGWSRGEERGETSRFARGDEGARA